MSWLTRTTGRFAITPRALLQAVGVVRQTASTGAAVRRALSPDRVSLLGLQPADEAAELAAPHPTATALRRNQTLYRRRTHRVERVGPRYCPACLATNSPYWPKSWLLTTSLVCTRHRLRLVEACPCCGREPFSRRDWLTTTGAIYECPHALSAVGTGRRVRSRCRADLRTAPAETASADDVAAQRLLDTTAAADPQALVSTCGTQVEAAILFGAILDLTENLRAQGEQELAARARVATALQCTSPAVAITHLGSLDEPATSAGVHNPLAEALRLQTARHHLSPTRQLELRAARPFLARPVRDGQRPRTAHTLPKHRTPRPTLHELRHASLPRITTTDGTVLPTAVARLLAARLGRSDSWADLARNLDIPIDIAHTMGTTLRSLQQQKAWAACLHILESHLEARSGS